MKKLKLFFIALIATTALSAQVNQSLGLMAYYPFSGNANDMSGNGNNPLSNTAVLTTDRAGNINSAYHFNGTSNFMEIPGSASLNLSNQISICAWVRVTGFYQNNCHGNNILSKGGDDAIGRYILRFDDHKYNTNNCNGNPPDIQNQNFYGVNADPATSPYIQPLQWYSVVYTYNGTIAKIYVNCILRDSMAIAISSFTNSENLFFGKLNSSSNPYWFNGDMDEVRIYNRAINKQEIDYYGGCALPPTEPSTGSCSDTCNWKLLGNPNVTSSNFIGSINAADFNIKTSNMQRVIVKSNGNVGIGTIKPLKLLHVEGEARVAVLPPAVTNDRIVFANAAGDLHAQVILQGAEAKNQYLSGDGTFRSVTELPNASNKNIDDITKRLNSLEDELVKLKVSNQDLLNQLTQTDVVLKNGSSIILNQNVPNPFTENTTITYALPKTFKSAQIVFTAMNGEVIKKTDIKQGDKGMLNVFAKDISSGLYTYTLIIDGKIVETKKMVKQ